MWMLRRTLTKDAEAEAGAEAEALVGVVDGSELWELGGLGSRGSELSLRPDEEGTSMGRQDAEEGREEAPRLVAEGEEGTRNGEELPVEGTDTKLRSSISATDVDSSPGLGNGGRGSESEPNRDAQRKSHCERKKKSQVFVRELRDRGREYLIDQV